MAMSKKANISLSKTPAPKADRIYGSEKNPKGSAESSTSAKNITLGKNTIDTLRNKLSQYKKKYPSRKDVSLNDVKAVYRRGSGAYSSTHRPTISGGKPNSRAAWSYARVNKFLQKAAGLKVKKAYIQDDDLLKRGGQIDPEAFDLVFYHEKKGNWLFAKNKMYVWLYDDLEAGKKLQSGEYDWIIFPPTAGIYAAFRKGYVPPLKAVWTKKFQKDHKGSDKLVGIVEAYYDEQENKLYVLMMSTRKDYQRRGVNSYLIKFLREQFKLEKDKVIFDKPTEEGKKFEASGKFEQGGDIKNNSMNKIQLPDTESSYENLQPILAKQGYELSRALKPTKSVEEIAEENNVSKTSIEAELKIGIIDELAHTNSRQIAREIALHHLAENSKWYTQLKEVELKNEAQKLEDYYRRGGALSEETTCEVLDAEGERKITENAIENLTACINELPQTKSMHFDYATNDYKPYRKRLHKDIIYEFKKDVICVEREQPIAILMGGSPASGKSTFLKKYSPYLLKNEILKVDADEIRARLPEYRGYNASQTHLETKDIVNTLLSDRNIGIPCRFDVIYDGTMNNTKSYIPLIDVLKEQGYKVFIVYIDNVPKDVVIKRALERYKKSGRFVPLEVIEDFFGKGKSALEQLKKEVDGYMIVDGGTSEYKIIESGGDELPQDRNYSKIGSPITITSEEVIREMKRGGEVDPDNSKIKQAITHKSGSAGGLLVGNRHSEGGIKAVNKSTGQPLEMEGGEVVITRDAVSDESKREFEGEMLTNREILSRINESGGGVSFAKGGDVPHKCSCSGKQYKFGGKLLKDNDIVKSIIDSSRKTIGIGFPELKPSEAFKKIFANKLRFEQGGDVNKGDTIVLVDTEILTFNGFAKANKEINPQAMLYFYKKHLSKNYFMVFDELPHLLKSALLLGKQELADNYINA
jgi:predicted ABC-type ATPase